MKYVFSKLPVITSILFQVTGIESVLTSLLGSDVDIDTIEQW